MTAVCNNVKPGSLAEKCYQSHPPTHDLMRSVFQIKFSGVEGIFLKTLFVDPFPIVIS